MTALIDETLPLDTDLAGNGAARIRETRAALNDLKDECDDRYNELKIVGVSVIPLLKLIPISPTFPWFCLSYPNVNFTTANYSTEFIDELRSRKYIYDEFGTSPVSAFSGSWSSNVFTLTDNAANKAMLAELAEDWLYHGSPTTNWRILSDGTTEFNITGINVTSRTITVNLDSETATGTSVELYTNRVYRDATKARHFSEAGLATYQAGGGKSGRLFRRDQMQGHRHKLEHPENADYQSENGIKTAVSSSSSTLHGLLRAVTGASPQQEIIVTSPITNGVDGTPRTGSETIAKSSSRYEYLYVGSYTA